MKKINYFPVLSLLAGVLAATLFFSCAKNEVADPNDSIQNPIVDTEPDGEGSEPEIPETPDDPTLIPQEGEMTEDGRPVVMLFGARIGDDEEEPEADSESTKTHLGTPSAGKYPNYWSVGDQVKINDTPSATLPSENIYEGGKQARFPMAEVVSKYNGNWYVGYPAAQFSFSNGTGTVTVPSVQTYVSGSYDPDAYILLGKSASQSMRFYPKMAVVRFTPQDADPSYGSNIKSVRIEAIGNDAMSGQFTTDYNNESASFAPMDGQSYPYVQINAPNQASGLAFGTQFFFLIPAKTYSEGIRFVITTVDGKSMSVSKTGAYTASVSTTSTIKPPKYVPSTVTLTSPLQWTSSAILSWTGGNSANDFKKAWRLAVYSNSVCTSLVVSHDIPADPDKSAHWKDVDGSTVMSQPRFAVTGLNPGTHYWCKVTDISNNVSSEVLEITTESFTRVTAASPSGSTLLAEDFSEIAVGTVWSNCAAGWTPANSAVEEANSLSLAAPTGVVTTGYYQEATYATNNLSSKYDFTTAPRFNAGWGFVKDGSALTIYPQAGFLRVGGKNSSRTMIVCPQLSGITTGKYATVDVTLKIAQCVSADVANNDLAVFIESDLTLDNSASRVFSGATYTRAYPLGISTSWKSSETKTVRINGVSKTDRLMIGAYRNVENNNRFFLYQVKVEKVSESATELFDITDDVSLRTFYTRVNGGATDLDAIVRNDVTASSTTASGWAPLAGYTGTLEGNNKTITGLTKPFFADLQGTVQNLTLNSTISCTNASQESTAIFAQELNGGTITYCTSIGSVYYCPSSYVRNATRYVAGIVGTVTSGSMDHCTNYASITVPHNDQDNDMIMEVGGVVARLASSTACSYLHNVYDTGIGGANSGKISVGIHQDYDDSGATDARQCRIGGVIAYVTTGATSISYCTNSGAVEYTGTSYGALKVGGIVGYARRGAGNCQNSGSVTITGAASVTRGQLFLGGLLGHYESNDTLTDSNNTGAVSNAAPTTGDDINVGGLVGKCYRSISSCYNSGTVDNSGNSGVDVCIGGITGNVYYANSYSVSLTGCYNTNRVRNTGSGGIIAIGGLVGWSGQSTSYASTCYNSGAVSNTGQGTNTTAGVRIGGLVGCARNSNNLSGSNYNQGTVTEQSATASAYVAVGGICGYADNASTSLASAQNRSAGTVTLSLASKTITYAYVGGVLGYAGAACSLSGASNAAPINAKTTTTADKMYLGGVLGYTASANTLSNISNSGALTINNLTCSTSLYAGGLVGYNGGGVISGTAGNAATGDMSITMKSTGPSYIGGLAGYSSGTITGTNRGDVAVKKYSSYSCADSLNIGGIVGMHAAALSSCKNYGAISNTATVTGAHNINLGGIAGASRANLSSCENMSSGSVLNSGNSERNIFLGGVSAVNVANRMTSCTNAGTVKNEADGAILAVGGLVGRSTGTSSYVSVCVNTGSIYNTGYGDFLATEYGAEYDANGDDANIRTGGLIGWIDGANDLGDSTSGLSYGNYNNGPVFISTQTNHVAVGGICGYAPTEGAKLEGSQNKVNGDITLTRSGTLSPTTNYFHQLKVGGVLGDGTYVSIDGSSNAGDIIFDQVSVDQFWCGGVIGHWHPSGADYSGTLYTVQNCSNYGAIRTKTQNMSTGSDIMPKGTTFCYLGGIVGGTGSDHRQFVYVNCESIYTGSGYMIDIYSPTKMRIGGIAATCARSTSNCTVKGNIRYKRNNTSHAETQYGIVGGIVGFSRNDCSGYRAYNNDLYSGTIDTNGSYPLAYTAGIIGLINSSTPSFSSTKVGGVINGEDQTSNKKCGIFYCRTSTTNPTFSNCIIGTGLQLKTASSTWLTVNSVSDAVATKLYLVGAAGLGNIHSGSGLSVGSIE